MSLPPTPPQGFVPLLPPFSHDQARAGASSCLYCYDAPCTRACPTEIDVPRFIRQIRDDDPCGAAQTILDANPLGRSCARVCPTEVLCEGACVVNTHLAEPIPIGQLQRYACDEADAAGYEAYTPGPDSGFRVAIVGGGPAGLSCATLLRQLGHAVTIYEAAPALGGLNRTGIAAYKLTPADTAHEVAELLKLGPQVELNQAIDPTRLAALREAYDAVYLAVGLGAMATLDLGNDAGPGVQDALTLIESTRQPEVATLPNDAEVVVIGAGNTALDAANAAVRLGAGRVTLAYRRSERDMPGFAHEYQLALRSGVQFLWEVQPIGVRRTDGDLTAVTLSRPDGSSMDLPCTLLVPALGQTEHPEWGQVAGLALVDGRLEVDERGRTSLPKLYAGGDCRRAAREEVVYAAEDGKQAAFTIDADLRSGA